MTHAFHTRRSSDLERGTGTSVAAVVGVALVDLAGEVPAAATAHEPTTVPVWRPAPAAPVPAVPLLLDHLHRVERSEEHTSELHSLMRISYAVFCFNQYIFFFLFFSFFLFFF